MLVLRTFKPFRGTLPASPFTLKAEALLAMAGLAYERELAMPQKQLRGKMPVLLDGETVIPDSGLIQQYLERAWSIDFDKALDPQQKAQATALRRLVEDHLYVLAGHYRWALHGDVLTDAFFADAPTLLRGFLFPHVDKKRIVVMQGQGLGRHDDAHLRQLVADDVRAMAGMLGQSPFLFGATPTSIDASVWGCIHSSLCCDLDTPVRSAMLGHDNLVAYEARFRSRFFGGQQAGRYSTPFTSSASA